MRWLNNLYRQAWRFNSDTTLIKQVGTQNTVSEAHSLTTQDTKAYQNPYIAAQPSRHTFLAPLLPRLHRSSLTTNLRKPPHIIINRLPNDWARSTLPKPSTRYQILHQIYPRYLIQFFALMFSKRKSILRERRWTKAFPFLSYQGLALGGEIPRYRGSPE